MRMEFDLRLRIVVRANLRQIVGAGLFIGWLILQIGGHHAAADVIHLAIHLLGE